jgi:predicted permease
VDHFRQDIRYALRTWVRNPLFAITIVLTLGLGIGANTAIFSFVDTMLLRPLPYPDPDDVVVVWQDFSATGGPEQEWFTPPDYADLVAQAGTLEAVSTIAGWNPNLTGVEQAQRLSGLAVSPGYFTIAGTAPVLGRAFTDAESAAGAAVAVISDGLWRTTFGADPDILGSTIQLMGSPWTVVGVMPPEFEPPFQQADIWRPFTRDFFGPGCMESRACYVTQVLARLHQAVSIEQARMELAVFSAGLRESDPGEKAGVEVRIVPLREQLAGPVGPPLLALLGAVGLVLLIACVNVANLLLAKAARREREVAVRTAIGASRGTLFRQLLTESVLVGLAGGAAGVLVAFWGVDVLVAMSPPVAPRLAEVGVDLRGLGMAFTLSLATGLLFGLAPALHLSRVDVHESLKETSGGGGSRQRSRLRNILVAAEVAIAIMLLAGAGLMARSLLRLQAVDPGFDPSHAAAVQLLVPQASYAESDEANALYDALIGRLSSYPTVSAAGAVSILPMAGFTSDTGFLIEGRPLPPERAAQPVADYRSATPGYLEAAGLRLLRGRWLEASDRAGVGEVIVINESFARRYWPNEDAIGKRVSYRGPEGPYSTVVGIVADVRHRGLDQPTRPEMYMSYLQLPARQMYVVARTRESDAATVVAQIRSIVNDLDRDLPLAGQTTLDGLVGQSVAVPRLFVAFFGFFAFVALLLAAVGIYGVTAHAVSRRSREIGIRIALGADARRVVAWIVGQSMIVTLSGLAFGMLAALALAGSIGDLLFELSPTDPLTFATVAAILAAVALLASWVPARRAARLQPMTSLRSE